MNDPTGEEGGAATTGLLPRGYPFDLVHRVVAAGEDEIVAMTTVERAQPAFAGHFPGRPVLPGVLVCEALAQAGALLLRRQGILPPGLGLAIVGIERMRFRRAVVPPAELRLEVRLAGRARHGWRLRGRALLDTEVAAEGEIRAAERGRPS